jgi:hypothetical protein
VLESENPASNHDTSNGDTEAMADAEVSLLEAAQAVIAERHGKLKAVRHRLDGDEIDVDMDSSELPSPREQALHVAAQLESCAGALRDAEEA